MKKSASGFRSNAIKWLYPNLGVKRWFLLAVLGIFLFAAGLSVMNYGVALGYLEVQFREMVYHLTGSAPQTAVPMGVIISSLGVTAIVIGFKRMLNSVISVLLPDDEGRIVDVMYTRQHLRRGPKIVVIGGGTGLSALLRGLKEYTCNLTAIVTVADDGGSSGRLRHEMGILPPGDVRNCLVALADTENIMEHLFSYRFNTGTLKGHSLGNLLIAGLADTFGDFQKGIESVSKVFALRGNVYPSTLEQVVLGAELEDGSVIKGETAARDAEGRIKRVFLEPSDCHPIPEALKAIEEADLIVLGPGSLYTSVLPNLLVEGLQDKLREVQAPCVYVCNIMTEQGETDDYKVADHLQAIVDHCGADFVDVVLANNREIPQELLERYAQEGSFPVVGEAQSVEWLGVKYVERDLLLADGTIRHDSVRLARELIRLLFRMKPMGERIALVDSYLLSQKLKEDS
ncbi:gluconeogenesis factor YvcK family protein [Desulfitobacterium sp.]|uniref:gluconeogenesis factor YvcK family protein n=1 Tax=Desulfitobacterium sp. TaxID=49981 RepID=UPI002D04BDCF|nr:gluconeogenesis factor YvcK family protein [Desulfitobacterium sp.]HVJ47956.1 gluconeogenesis factor YvcK family protein [Desulfitobacterium sp.]